MLDKKDVKHILVRGIVVMSLDLGIIGSLIEFYLCSLLFDL